MKQRAVLVRIPFAKSNKNTMAFAVQNEGAPMGSTVVPELMFIHPEILPNAGVIPNPCE